MSDATKTRDGTADAAAAADPVRDPARLAEIAALGLSGTEVDEVLQQTVDEAAARLGLPTSLVTIVLDEAQWFAAHTGLSGWLQETRGTPVEWSFCATAVRTGEPFVVEDAEAHPLVKDNPMVRMEGIRCYAGIPLVTSTGHTLGTLCVAGNEPRSFSEADLEVLRDLAGTALERIEARRGQATNGDRGGAPG
jgi:GAF domain-containing protein